MSNVISGVIIALLLLAGSWGEVLLPPDSSPEPQSPARVGDGQPRPARHAPHFPLCAFCCRCCRNRGCGFCCRT